MPDWNPRANDLFLKALDLPPADRPAFLAGECGDDAGLRRAVETLLNAHEKAGDFLADPFVSVGTTATFQTGTHSHGATTTPVGEAGQVIAGRYKLIERIGEGGMGAVWMADQTEPVKRKVAVKLIKAGLDSKQVLARFKAERQALALMDHPNIAKVLDGGVHDGRPFFVMELVKGVPITQFCDARRLTPQQRLELFVPVCQAIQHAHQKGVIHRDIKPANVLVALYDDKPVPKVIDFGVAKATGPTLTEHTLNTGFGGVVGTPQYMSPEQATFNNLDIDTRSDVYSLGVLLYELLAGSPPFIQKELERRGLLEILRVVREEEPPRPSTKLSTADALPSLAASRGTEPRKLTGLLRNELDWVVMKALEKDRTRRYETANGFAADVQRYLSGEPVAAHPPTAGYRLRKFVRKNKGPVVAGTLLVLALSLGIAGTTFGLVRAEQAKQRESERADGEQKAKDTAEAEKKRAIEFRDKALDALRATTGDDVEKLIGEKKELTANEKVYLEAIAQRWQIFAKHEGADEQSRTIQAEGHFRMAVLWHKMGRMDEARPGYEQALAVRERLVADFPTVPEFQRNLAASHNNLGTLLRELGKPTEAMAQHWKALSIKEKLVAEYPAVPGYRQSLARSHHNLGTLLSDLGKEAEAEEQYRVALTIREKLMTEFSAVPDYRLVVAGTHNDLGYHLSTLRKWREAGEQYQKAAAVLEKLPAAYAAMPDYGTTLGESYCNFGRLVCESRTPAESLPWYDKAIDTLRPICESYPQKIAARLRLIDSYWGRADVYERLHRRTEATADWNQVLALSSPGALPWTRAKLATARLRVGQVAEAVAEVAELRKMSEWNAGQLYDFACVYAVASDKIADKKAEYADAAVDLLTKAVKAGWTDAAHLKRDTDLDPLRDRDDFKKLVADLEARFPPKREVLPPPQRDK